jgi:hypothetical protein
MLALARAYVTRAILLPLPRQSRARVLFEAKIQYNVGFLEEWFRCRPSRTLGING